MIKGRNPWRKAPRYMLLLEDSNTSAAPAMQEEVNSKSVMPLFSIYR